MRPLILSCNTGEGHNSAAKAIKEQFEKQGMECPMLDALAFASRGISRFVCGVYIKTASRAPGLFGFSYRACAAVSNTHVKSLSYIANTLYAKPLYRYIKDNGIDTVVTTHLFPAQCLTHIRKKYRASFKMYLVCTDNDCWPFVEETRPDVLFIAHELLKPEYVLRGVKEDILYASGIPVSAKFAENVPKNEARRALGFPEDVPVILIMGGSMGFGSIADTVALLTKRMSADTHIVVLAGNNERMKSSLCESYDGDARVHVMGYTDKACLFMKACDVIMTKPGGLSSTEAAAANIPIVHTKPIPGCETANIGLYTATGMSVAAGDSAEAAEMTLWLLSSPEKRAAMVEAQRRNVDPHAAAEIVRIITERA